MVKKILISLGISLGIISVLIILGSGLLWHLFGKAMCGDEPMGKYLSPNGKHEVVYYLRNCGATTYWADNVELDGKNVFRAVIYGQRPPLLISWSSPSQVMIGTATGTTQVRIWKMERQYRGIEILYDQMIEQGERVGI